MLDKIRITCFLSIFLMMYSCKAYSFENCDYCDTTKVDISLMGRQYVITDYGVENDSVKTQTDEIQALIDMVSSSGGGVIVVPKGTFLTGSLFFKKGVSLYVVGKLKGADRIRHFQMRNMRLSGIMGKWFSALINAENLNGFTIAGPGIIDGNGFYYWEEFWLSQEFSSDVSTMNHKLLYIANCKNVTIQDVSLNNSPNWNCHLYNCDQVRILNVSFFAPTKGVYWKVASRGAPSTDGIDIDACHDVFVYGCKFHVNDDAIALKGGKGAFADMDSNNGANYNIAIDSCYFDETYGCLTLGSESFSDYDIILKNCFSVNAKRVLRLKMRADTPQEYSNIHIEGIKGYCKYFIEIQPWTANLEVKPRDDMPLSSIHNVYVQNINMTCSDFFYIHSEDDTNFNHFFFSHMIINDDTNGFSPQIHDCFEVVDFLYNGIYIGKSTNVKGVKYMQKNTVYDLKGIRSSKNKHIVKKRSNGGYIKLSY